MMIITDMIVFEAGLENQIDVVAGGVKRIKLNRTESLKNSVNIGNRFGRPEELFLE